MMVLSDREVAVVRHVLDTELRKPYKELNTVFGSVEIQMMQDLLFAIESPRGRIPDDE